MGSHRTLTTAGVRVASALYASGKSYAAISRRFGVSESCVSRHLRRAGVVTDVSRARPAGPLNQRFFDDPITEPAAYWLGFLIGDGQVHADGRVVVALAARDEAHLVKLRHALGANKPLVHRTLHVPVAELRIYSKGMVARLSTLECFQSKTCRHGFPAASADLWPHIIRGLFDADGSLARMNRRVRAGTVRRFVFSLVGSARCLRTIGRIIRHACRAKVNICRPRHGRKGFVVLTVTRWAHVERVMDWLYQGATVWLDRKRLTYDEMKRCHRDNPPKRTFDTAGEREVWEASHYERHKGSYRAYYVRNRTPILAHNKAVRAARRLGVATPR